MPPHRARIVYALRLWPGEAYNDPFLGSSLATSGIVAIEIDTAPEIPVRNLAQIVFRGNDRGVLNSDPLAPAGYDMPGLVECSR